MIQKKRRSADIPQCSMADIAFLLLLFFLVTTTINVDKGIGLVLPPKGETKEVHKKNIVNVLVSAEGTVMIGEEIVEIPMVSGKIRSKMMENPNLIISVKTDANTSYRDYVKVLDQLKQADAKRISIAEPEEK